tara:strand:+ start:389 stop:616 length:228 start_codon:yes stop_codon:yes gene_type:complete
MRKDIFYNNKLNNEDLKITKITHLQSVNTKANVNINSLLNRVKTDKENENKKTIIFFMLGISLIGLMGIFVTIVS